GCGQLRGHLRNDLLSFRRHVPATGLKQLIAVHGVFNCILQSANLRPLSSDLGLELLILRLELLVFRDDGIVLALRDAPGEKQESQCWYHDATAADGYHRSNLPVEAH